MSIFLNKGKPENPLSDMCKRIRQEKRMTQAELAKSLKVATTDISLIERGFMPTADTVVKLADMYKQTLYYQNKTLFTVVNNE